MAMGLLDPLSGTTIAWKGTISCPMLLLYQYGHRSS